MIAENPDGGQRRIHLDRYSATPFYRQIYERFRDAITSGALRPGERLPSARSLASQLATARGTVNAAYDLLAGEGYIIARGAAGTMVTPGLADHPGSVGDLLPAGLPTHAPPGWRPGSGDDSAGAPLPFQMGLPALDLFPRALWSRLAVRRARAFPTGAMAYPDSAGYRPLREAIVSYLAIARGILCTADQVIITGGFQSALGLITRVLLRPGDTAWIEDPGYFLARQGLAAAGAELAPVPVDGEGIDVAAGIAQAPGSRFAVVTPSHQFPLGMALSLPRRLALLAWAEAAKAWIIEDDYDSEFRYIGRPLPALRSLDRAGRVLYAGSFSKVLFPGLRLGYLVVPESEIRAFHRICQTLHPDRSGFIERVVADFMTEGHFARHIKRMRGAYAQRRAALSAALIEVFGDRFTIDLQAGGMHLLARAADRESDRYLVRLANAHGLALEALSDASIDHHCGQGLLLSFTNIPRDAARREALRLRQALTG
jgi:GntR family transcriptional regulator/MocR family aminotransferase